MRLLITADLHLVQAYRERVLGELASRIKLYRPDGLLIAGDLSTPAEAARSLQAIRSLLPQKPIGLALGNHDFWVRPARQCGSLAEVVDEYWANPAFQEGVTLLDRENLALDGFTVCGGYGHYDLGFATPGLRYASREVRQEDYLSGRPPVRTNLRWQDFDRLPSGIDLLEVARAEVAALEKRLAEANGTRLWAILHTPPLEELLGLPKLETTGADEHSVYAFFRAYLGNRLMGESLIAQDSRLRGIFCGHTHRPTELVDFGAFRGINIGSNYGQPRACLLDSDSEAITRIDP